MGSDMPIDIGNLKSRLQTNLVADNIRDIEKV